MKKPARRMDALLRRAMVAAAVTATSGASAQATDLLPNLQPLPAFDISLVSNSTASTLRFSVTSWNDGSGRLELRAGAPTGPDKQPVYQRVYRSDGTFYDHKAGDFEWHPDHDHFHFNDYALYTLQPVNAPGGSSRIGSKTTFCVMDTTPMNLALPGAPQHAFYATCGEDIQGMSVGWGDTYGYWLAGQEVDFTDNKDGIYQLKIDIDPKRLLREGDEADNVSCVLLSIKKPSTVRVLDSSGSCATLQSISPSSAVRDTILNDVKITGYGLAVGMTVSFEGGTGPRPVASNVKLPAADDTDTLDTMTVTVTVPAKKQLGRNPVWDLRVGGGVLPRAFTVR